MKYRHLSLLLALLTIHTNVSGNETSSTQNLPQHTIKGVQTEDIQRMPKALDLTTADSSQLLQKVAGATRSGNGPISGQVHIRGLNGPRLGTSVSNMPIVPGGPNWMDPPLHYAPGPLIDHLEVHTGLVSADVQNESIGGHVNAALLQPSFGSSSKWERNGQWNIATQSAHRSIHEGGLLSTANQNHRIGYLHAYERGADLRFPGGKIQNTAFERLNNGVFYGYQRGVHALDIQYRRSETRDSGTPALPMDIVFIDTDLSHIEYRGELENFDLTSSIHFMKVDHQMDNFSQRQTPNFNPLTAGSDFRFANAKSKSGGYRIELKDNANQHPWRIGFEGHFEKHEMEVRDPTNGGFLVENFNDSKRYRLGLFSGLEHRFSKRTALDISARYNYVSMRTGSVRGPNLAPAIALANAFNTSSREADDHNFNAAMLLSHKVKPTLEWQFGLSRKTRSPSYIERFAWIPLEVTAGLADGNNTIGNLQLDPEVAHEIEAGLKWKHNTLSINPRLYYRHVENYIQSTPVDNTPTVIDSNVERVSRVNGDTTPLQYRNVDAAFYGFDVTWLWELHKHWQMSGLLNHIRAERRDINDSIYRMPPLNGSARLSYLRERWNIDLENQFAAKQDRVSTTNGESSSGGYGIWNLNAGLRLSTNASLNLQLHNLFDKAYSEHLSGINRVMNSDVPQGQRLPGAERSIAARLTIHF